MYIISCTGTCYFSTFFFFQTCFFCQKDIGGGEGFLAPIGNDGKGVFKDFCSEFCLKRFQVMNNLAKEDKVSRTTTFPWII